MRRSCLTLALLAVGASAPVKPPLLALTVDDLPAHGALPPGETRLEVARRIIAALKAAQAPAIGFVNGGFGTDDPQSSAVLAQWRTAGLPVGNHTYAHLRLDGNGAAAFLAEVDRNEPVLARLRARGAARWFRYPYLAEGGDPAEREAVRAGLRARGYRVAAVTMSFGDYAWNDAYARCSAKSDSAAIAALETSFLLAARVDALRVREMARAAEERDVPQVLLLHMGAFDARMMPRLLALYRELGFAFTTLAEAERDPFYAAATDLTRPGPSPTLEAAMRARARPVPPSAPLPGAEVCG